MDTRALFSLVRLAKNKQEKISMAFAGPCIRVTDPISKSKAKKVVESDIPQALAVLPKYCEYCGRKLFTDGDEFYCRNCGWDSSKAVKHK